MTAAQANDLLTWTGAVSGLLAGIWFTLLVIMMFAIRNERR